MTFLAAGEYNENYLIERANGRAVFRINHGSQLGIEDQVSYEYRVLQLVEPSGATPKPLRLIPACDAFPRGAIVMEFLSGGPLNYRSDRHGAAECFARIHGLEIDSSTAGLVVQADPVRNIVAECDGLLARYPDHPLVREGELIRRYRNAVLERAGDASFVDDRLCITNTEVNSGNFVVDDGLVRLVDWEKAVVSYRYQDLGHFLVPTTTLWKSDYRFTRADRRDFLAAYHRAASPPITLDELDRRTALLERTILLRAFSWVYMAWAEYESGDRPIVNPDTHATIRDYLARIDEFLEP